MEGREPVQPAPEKTTANRRKIILACAGLFVACCLALTGSGVFIIWDRENIPFLKSNTPTPSPAPHILVGQPAGNIKITKDDFSTNGNEWSTLLHYAKAEVKDGKLYLESFTAGNIAIGYCEACSFVVITNPNLESPYYLQADFNTDVDTHHFYGLVFSMLTSQGTLYSFEIGPWSHTYEFYKHDTSGWTELLGQSSKSIKSFPATNTLSVKVDQGLITLYINGDTISSYTDKNPLNTGQVGVMVDDATFKLSVDNLFAYHQP